LKLNKRNKTTTKHTTPRKSKNLIYRIPIALIRDQHFKMAAMAGRRGVPIYVIYREAIQGYINSEYKQTMKGEK
jgi:hypothetical protein